MHKTSGTQAGCVTLSIPLISVVWVWRIMRVLPLGTHAHRLCSLAVDHNLIIFTQAVKKADEQQEIMSLGQMNILAEHKTIILPILLSSPGTHGIMNIFLTSIILLVWSTHTSREHRTRIKQMEIQPETNLISLTWIRQMSLMHYIK